MLLKNRRIFCIVGPTAVGKSRLAVSLAKKIKGEIVSADAMQVYCGLPILTNCPPRILLKTIPHHFVSFIGLDKEFNVAAYIKMARRVIEHIIKKGRVPIIVGGSGLYVNALLDGIFPGPAEDRSLRKRLEKQASKFGNNYLYRRLKRIDPETASGIHPNNLKRIIRALEVCIKTGQKMSQLKTKRSGLWQDYDVTVIGLIRQRQALYNIIETRVDNMFKQGAIREVKNALNCRLSRTAKQIIGLQEIASFLKGAYNEEEARRIIKRNTRNLAKRQLTWFGRDKRIKWIEIEEKDKTPDILNKILGFI
jgi:tRNA dimethylallyltransferase